MYCSRYYSTTSFAHEDRGSMYVVEHHNDLFSWKKYNNNTHMLTLYEYRCKCVIIGCGNKLPLQKYNVLTQMATELCYITSWMSREYSYHTFPPLLPGLCCCSVGDSWKARFGLVSSPPAHAFYPGWLPVFQDPGIFPIFRRHMYSAAMTGL